jgi:myo-inositol-1(or 4)-monophosphatase
MLGVIDLPFLGEGYIGHEGHGAYLNGNRLQASAASALSGAVVSLGDFAVGPNADQRNQRRHEIMQQLAAHAERIRMLGSAAIDLAWVAAGRLDASVMLANKPWDVAAGVIIAREAGAQVLDLDGTLHTPDSLGTVSSAPGVVADLTELLRRTEHSPAS